MQQLQKKPGTWKSNVASTIRLPHLQNTRPSQLLPQFTLGCKNLYILEKTNKLPKTITFNWSQLSSKKDPLQNINSILATLLVLKQTILEIEPELTDDANITRQLQGQVWKIQKQKKNLE